MTTVPSTQIGKPIEASAVATRTRARPTVRIVVMICVIGAVAAAASWAFAKWSGPILTVDKSNHFTVNPRDFDVLLHEKGELQTAKSTDITCEVEGRTTIISLIDEGTTVKKGDLLVELASDEIENRILEEELKEANAITAYEAARNDLEIQLDLNASNIRKADLQIELKRLELEKYKQGEWVQKKRDADIAIEQAGISLNQRKEDFDAAKELLPKKYITKTEYNTSEFDYKKAQWEVEKARLARQVLEDYTHVADLRSRESDLEEALKEADRIKKDAEGQESTKRRTMEGKKKELELTQDQLAKLREQREKCRITAPTPGFVVYYGGGGRWMSEDNQIKEGATVHERQILMQLPDTSQMIVKVRIHEAKMDKLALGQRAAVEIEGVPGKRFMGSVTKIASVADTQNRWLNPDLKEYESEISLESTDVPLKPGATAHAEIMVEHVGHRLAVPVQGIYASGGNRFVFKSGNGGVIPVPVTLGAVGSDYAEITGGLNAGEEILLSFTDEQRRLIADLPENHRGPKDRAGPPDGDRRGGRGPRAGRKAGGSEHREQHQRPAPKRTPSNSS